MIFSTIINGKEICMNISNDNEISILNKKNTSIIDCTLINDDTISLILNGNVYYLTIMMEQNGYEVMVNHFSNFVEVKNRNEILKDELGLNDSIIHQSGEVHAQIPGLVSRIDVKSGNYVKKGDTLCILEAMKMENEIKSPISGTIKAIQINPGKNVDKGDLLMEIIS